MPKQIRIKAGDVELAASLNDTDTARLVWGALPITEPANIWGDEIYFSIEVDAELEEGQEVVELGDLGYWPPGRAFCIFFGPTPMSQGEEIRPASAVTVIGKLADSGQVLKGVPSGAPVTLERG